MTFFSLLFCSLLAAYWFQRELKHFPLKLNQQIYQDAHSLVHLPLSMETFLENSILKEKNTGGLYYFLFPFSLYLFYHATLFIIAIIFILIYLSLLDYHYYLTDSRYVALILFLSLCELHSMQPMLIKEHLTSLIFCILFFALFIPCCKVLFKKDVLGSGDALLFISLSPLFELTKLFTLLLYASLLGLIFSVIYWLTYQTKLQKLPFIPFISLASTILLYCEHHAG